MSAEQEKFEELRRLLAIKRHEQPPPGYFNNFSHQVIARIRAGETSEAESLLGRLLVRAPWLQRLWDGFEAKPIVAGAFGVGVCGLLVVGLVSSERVDSTGMASPNGEAPQTIFANVPASSPGSLFDRAVDDHASTGSVFTAQSRSSTSIFDEIRPHVQQVNFSVPSTGN